MLTLVSEEVEAYARRCAPEESPVLRELAAYTREHTDAPEMMIGPVGGAVLRLAVRMTAARRVLEIGTFTGYTALMMAEALPETGELVTLDRDETTGAAARKFWAKSPHGRKIRAILGDARETVRGLEGPFDVAFIDADKDSYPAYWEACVPLVRPGGVLLADNVLRGGAALSPRSESDRIIAGFNERVAGDPRVESMILTVRDGITLAVKR